MVDRAIQVVDAVADDSWAQDCAILMPTYRARVQAEQEAVRRTAEEAAERERAAAERELAAEAERRESFRTQQDAAKLERERKSRVRKQEREVHNKESKLLSPESSRAVAKRKSGSSLGESGSGGEIERKIAPKGTQGKGSRKDKGKAPAKAPAQSQGLQDPPEFPNGSCQVSFLPTFFAFIFHKDVFSRRCTPANAA